LQTTSPYQYKGFGIEAQLLQNTRKIAEERIGMLGDGIIRQKMGVMRGMVEGYQQTIMMLEHAETIVKKIHSRYMKYCKDFRL
jgi:hypothetical protein